jgi:diguanylate cyclase (GGDEF)-like protein
VLHQATHDELTGLPNRNALLTRLRELCAIEPEQPFALLLLDVDRFKLFNEAHGPSVGDEVLRALAEGLVQSMAHIAEVMRLGEDEFALLAPAMNAEQAARDLQSGVRQLLTHALVLPRHRFFLDVSMGIALHPATAQSPEALLRSANAAMHEAKRTPGTSVQYAEERFERGSGATLDAEQAMRAGMNSGEFRLVYQPKVDARTTALVGFEALVRWDRPGIGRIGPHEFIPAAERTGLIGPLGNMILALACRQIADWRDAHGETVPVAVNVSPLQLLDPGFPELVVQTLRQFNVAPELLTLEITETAAVTHMEQAREQISQMRAHGIEVALDDFGTGFSSLNMLRSLPLSTVKIDRSLIEPMPAPDATAVVRAICDLAGALHLVVVAEGVETPEQAAAAIAAGCTVLQGYLYARPLEPADAAAWMHSGHELIS